MSEQRSRTRLWLRVVPMILVLLLVGWCSFGRDELRKNATVKRELTTMMWEAGLIESPMGDVSLTDMVRYMDQSSLNELLYDAADSASFASVKWLVTHGAEPANVGLGKNPTLLQKVARYGERERLDYFVGLGLNPLERSNDGRTLLHVAAQGSLTPQFLQTLLEKGVELDDVDGYGRRPMHYASTAAVDVLLAAGAVIDPADREGLTPLHLAAKNGRNAEVVALLARSASVYAKDKNGRTPLHHAAMARGPETLIDTLIAAGAPLTARDNDGLTPRDAAVDARDANSYRGILDKLEGAANR